MKLIAILLLLSITATAQRINTQLTYTATGQAGAGIGFTTAKGYGITLQHYADVSYKTESEIFTTRKGTILSLSKRLMPAIEVNIGAGYCKTDRHNENNEWDNFKTFAIYQIGTDVRLCRNFGLVSGAFFGYGLVEVYSGVRVSINIK